MLQFRAAGFIERVVQPFLVMHRLHILRGNYLTELQLISAEILIYHAEELVQRALGILTHVHSIYVNVTLSAFVQTAQELYESAFSAAVSAD